MQAIEIRKLFGMYDYTIDLSKRCTILIGENGAGKSTIIRILRAVQRMDFVELCRYRFESVIVRNGDESIIIRHCDIMPRIQEEHKHCTTVDYDCTGEEFEFEVDADSTKAFWSDVFKTIEETLTPEDWNWAKACIYHKIPLLARTDRTIRTIVHQQYQKYDDGPEEDSGYPRHHQIIPEISRLDVNNECRMRMHEDNRKSPRVFTNSALVLRFREQIPESVLANVDMSDIELPFDL